MSLNPSRPGGRLGRGALSLLVLATSSTLLWSASSGAAFAGGPDPTEPVCSAGTCVVSFAATGAVQTWTVPTGVTSVSATVAGAGGGSATGSAAAGSGGRTAATVTVAPGDQLSLVTGGAGSSPAAAATGGAGTYGGGGSGGDNVNIPAGAGGASGGGGSFLFDGAVLLLAAGGGGGSSASQAGGAGGAADQPAAAGMNAIFGSNGGQPGTVDANGAGGGLPDSFGSGDATSATVLPLGGRGGDSVTSPFPFETVQGAPGAGGGGGYHAGGGGAGPASFLPGISTAGAGGGGGAGFAAESATDVVGQAGVQTGDGVITLSYAAGLPAGSITFTSDPDNAIVGRDGYSVSADGIGVDPVTFSIDPSTTNGACTIAGRSAISFAHVGTCVIAADQPADAFHTAGHKLQSFTVGQGNQTITFTPLPATGAVGDTLPLEASGEPDSGSPVVFSVGAASTLGACTVDGTSVTLTGAGTCAVLAAQASTPDYKAAITISHEVTVSRVATTTAVTFSEEAPVFGQPVTATATVTGVGAGTVQFSVDGDPVGDPVDVADGKAALAMSTTLGAGGHPVSAVFSPTDAATYGGSTGTATLAVGKALTHSTISVRADQASVVVEAVAPGSGTPEGTVRFTVGDGTPSAPVTLVRGRATLAGTIPGDTDVSVAYSGDDDFAASSDSTLRQNPTIEASVSSDVAKSPAGWYRSPVTVTYTCHAGSAPLTGGCPSPVTLSDDGASQSVTKTVLADDGGIATASTTGINIDRTKPVVGAFAVAEGSRFLGSAPEAGCVATDSLSGVSLCAASRKVDGKSVTYSVAAADQAGNVSTEVVHATTYNRGIADVPYVDGVYQVHAGQAVTLVAKSSHRARVMAPTLAPKKPTKNGDKFASTGDDTWALGYTIPTTLKEDKVYNLGIRTSHKYTVKIHVIA